MPIREEEPARMVANTNAAIAHPRKILLLPPVVHPRIQNTGISDITFIGNSL